jgi:peptide/nickel transport system permease protein
MLFGTRKEKKLAAAIAEGKAGTNYWSIVNRQFQKNRFAVWSLRLLYVLLFIAVFADFLANDKPLYCQIDGETHYPLFKSYLVGVGLAQWEPAFAQADWHKLPYEKVRYTLIPYSAKRIDLKNNDYRSPFDKQRVKSKWFTHWLGTDQLGHDVAARMIHGTRTAMLVGVIAMFIASVIGIGLGAIAGFFGDNRLKMSRVRVGLNLVGVLLGSFFAFISRGYMLTEGAFGWEITKSVFLLIAVLIVANLIARPLERIPVLGKPIRVPVDLIVMRLIEIMNAIPTLLLLLAIIATIKKSSIFHVMVIIGLIRWTGIARFIRAELLRIRQMEYIEAARALGLSEWRVMLRHAIPNALTPVLITISFGIAGAILLEAFLSFLSIGSTTDATWGGMLTHARSYPKAWWMALFPGMAIFITVTIFNLLGEGLTDAMDPKWQSGEQ